MTEAVDRAVDAGGLGHITPRQDRRLSEVSRGVTGDARLVAAVWDEGFVETGEAWITLQASCAEYAWSVLVAWGVNGELWQKAKGVGAKGLGTVPRRLKLREPDAGDLPQQMIEEAITPFREKHLRRWDPAGGASLNTYFVTCCLWQLKPAYERLYPTRVRRRKREVPVPPQEMPDGSSSAQPLTQSSWGRNPADVVSDRIVGQSHLDDLGKDPVVRELLELRRAGLTTWEAAQQMGKRAPTLTSRLSRARKRWGINQGGNEDS